MVKKAAPKPTFSSLQNSDRSSNATVIHSSFSPEGCHNYCIVTPGADQYRLRVFDTATGNVKNDYEEKGADGRWTCVRWGSIVEPGVSKKKRRSDHGEQSSPVLALGHSDGRVSIYSLAHGRVIHELKGSHTGKVNDFCFSKNGTRGFSAGEDGLICEWDIAQGVEMSKFQAETKSVKKVQLNHQETMILTAGHSMKLWSADTKELIKTFTGHASAITNVVFAANDKYVISTAEQDRFINLWDSTLDNQQEGTITALTLDNTVVNVDVSSTDAVLAISEDGTAGMWQNALSANASTGKSKASKKKRYTTRPCDCPVKYESSREENILIPLLSGAFTPQGQMVLARGSTIKPVFEKIDFQNEDGSLKEKDLVMSRAPVSGFLMDEAEQAAENVKATKKAYNEASVTVIGTTDFGMATPAVAEAGSESEDEDGEKGEGLSGERTLAEKLRDISVEDSAEAKTKKTSKYSTPKANSLQQMLIQALHSNDKQLLEACLQFSNVEIIRNTVRRLPTAYVVPFLTQVIDRFHKRPNRGELLLEWIKAVLLMHTAYLMTVPDLVQKLAYFHRTMDERVSVFQRLLNLQGRLDLVMSQIEMRQKYETEDLSNEATTVYVEDEEDVEGEDLDVAMESDEDDDDLVGEADAFDDDDEEDDDEDEEGLDSDMSDDDDVSDDEE
ncbi:WD repeat-containing protein 43 [Lunasporangiospora selenospora]|uniref:WD repeat-containing protein 43 n=1 Tax=Lunasporangiospora selenospora TaxID=979761 RepID=A0A9P6KDW2_9FUNG|nr:WD repeat-containing protein 43 [Lunasporangiospora selenospora]